MLLPFPRCSRVPALPLLLVVWMLCGPEVLRAQRLDMKVLGNYRVIEIPFDLENDFIVVPILLNSVVPLRFLVDTGAENTVLLDKSITDLLNVSYRRTFKVRGADVDTELTAYLATGVNLLFADRLLARNRSVLVLEENYFNFERITGTNIHGIIGGDFLMRFVVEFDFRRRVMYLHDPGEFRIKKSFVEIPSDFVRNRPYLNVDIGVLQDSSSTRRLLMDTGAGLSLLMHTYPDTDRSDLPLQTIPTHIASGLGGTVSGSVGRSKTVKLANRQLRNVITYFQEVDTAGLTFLNEREGIMGTRILKRFTVIVDYVKKKVYFKPEGRRWKQKFTYDRSGLNILAGGNNLHKYSVSNVVPNSPADRAGIKVGDRIRAVNGMSANLLSLQSIIRKLEGKPGRKIRLRVYRTGRLLDFTFALEDLI
ncbi:putative aspartyl protease [Lewinella aquimaris]|uniref:Putative aspartyl protease n=1 Tax=Neolewinella aquimaris TaxID=1835722 RepID=A0A840EA79_9BACT|nr:PDZ domain-containing protein [Neolewinella aquimaris]MBB4077916.1 putative aspartyl protease [Neolewinella aquimaris]